MPNARTPNGPPGFPDGKSLLDGTNRRLLAELTADPRASAAELARRVGMSAPAVRERIARLEEAGVIRGYRLDLDPAAIGLPARSGVLRAWRPGSATTLAGTLTEAWKSSCSWPWCSARSARSTASALTRPTSAELPKGSGEGAMNSLVGVFVMLLLRP